MSFLRTIAPLARRAVSVRTISTTVARRNAADPYVLPFDPALESMRKQGPVDAPAAKEEWPLPQPLDRTGETEKSLRARLVYQTRKRGTLETDLLLSTFARDFLHTMNVKELEQFDKLLDEPDWDIFYWAVEKRDPPAQWKDTELLEKLKKHAKNEGKVVRMMPALMQKEPTLS